MLYFIVVTKCPDKIDLKSQQCDYALARSDVFLFVQEAAFESAVAVVKRNL